MDDKTEVQGASDLLKVTCWSAAACTQLLFYTAIVRIITSPWTMNYIFSVKFSCINAYYILHIAHTAYVIHIFSLELKLHGVRSGTYFQPFRSHRTWLNNTQLLSTKEMFTDNEENKHS